MNPGQTDEKWVNLEDVAEYLSVSKDTIRVWMKDVNYQLIKPESDINSNYPRSIIG